jgi:hypothetical protein
MNLPNKYENKYFILYADVRFIRIRSAYSEDKKDAKYMKDKKKRLDLGMKCWYHVHTGKKKQRC